MGRVVAASVFAVVLSGQTYFKQFTEVEPVCNGHKPRHGKEVESGYSRDRLFEFAPGDPEYDRTVALLPRDVPGWLGDPPKVTVMSSHVMGCTLKAARNFKRNSDVVIVALMLGPIVELLKSEVSKHSQPSEAAAFRHKGYVGTLVGEKSNRVLMLYAGKVVVMISTPSGGAEMRGLLDHFDLDAIAALAP